MKNIYLPIVISLVLCWAGQCLAKDPAQSQAKSAPKQESRQSVLPAPAGEKVQPAEKPVAATSFGIVEPQDAAALFAEARKLAPTDPAFAIRLYLRGFVMQPEAWAQRKELAALYEKHEQWNLALAEYQTINKAVASAESFTDVIRMLDAAGYPREAAASARKAFAQYPGRSQFLLLVGDLLRKSGADDEALAVIKEYSKLNPKEGKPFFLSGSIHEKAGRLPEALQDYLRAEKLLKDDMETAAALKRIRSNAATIGGLTIFLPPGWNAENDGLFQIGEGQRVTLSVKNSGKPADLALAAALETMPGELFTAESRKSYEQLRKLRREMSKIDPEALKQMESIPLPLYSTGDFPTLKGAKKALLSTSESVLPGMESAVAIAVPKDGKIFIFLWRAALPTAAGEKTLTQLIGRSVWPL